MAAESLQTACELAYVVARDDAQSDQQAEPPASMRSFLYVSELPRQATTVAQQAIEGDSAFRSRVANKASEGAVGRAGFLWLHRPPGWATEFEELAEAAEETDLAEARTGRAGDAPSSAEYGNDMELPSPPPEIEEVYQG